MHTRFFQRRLTISKPIPKLPRKEWVIKKARAFLLKSNIIWLPVNPFEIARHSGWVILSADDVAKEAGVSRDNVITGKDSDVWMWNGHYKIVYNEKSYLDRIRFTIAHEIGHIVLNHLIEFKQTRLSRGGLTKQEYWVLEREADIFATNLLMPEEWVRIENTNYVSLAELGRLKNAFQVSWEAIINRLDELSIQSKEISYRTFERRKQIQLK